MRSRSITYLIVAALCACALATEQPAQSMPGDILVVAVGEPADLTALAAPPGPTNVWVPAQNIAATWESLTAMSKLSNPAAPSAKAAPERSLSLSARVDVVDVNNVLGFDYNAQGTLVLDEKLRVVYSKAVPSKYCHFYWPLRYTKKMVAGQWVSELQPYNFKVDMPIDSNHPYPKSLSRVEWSMYALVNTESKTVDVPFNVSADWVTLAPGVEIKVEQATAETGRYQYRLATRYSRSKVLWAPTGAATMIWTSDPTPEVIVTKLDILDAQGKSLKEGAASSSSSGGSSSGGSSSGGGGAAGPATRGSSDDGADGDGSATRRSSAGGAGAGGSGTINDSGDLITVAAEPTSDVITGTSSGMGTYTGAGTATKFRFTLALKPLQQQLRFILESVPVPSL